VATRHAIDDTSDSVSAASAREIVTKVRIGKPPGAAHRDPFDRMLIAQAMIDHMIFVSNEPQFDKYGVRRLW
jgi:PIN domain nuclease of toxin-antitoxin system